MSKETGGPAFPNVPTQGIEQWSSWDAGMTLRDYFAAKAMQGALANDDLMAAVVEGCESQAGFQLKLAMAAYSQADAMLAARAQS